MCRRIITLHGRELETVDELLTIVTPEDLVFEEPEHNLGVVAGEGCLCPLDLETMLQRMNWAYSQNDLGDFCLLEPHGGVKDEMLPGTFRYKITGEGIKPRKVDCD